MKITRIFCFLAVAFGLAAAPAMAQPVMKIGTATFNDVQHVYANRFAARVAKQAPGKLKVEVYPAEQLGDRKSVV